jgi:glycosyltransferase involved in cell wall biosynthesis
LLQLGVYGQELLTALISRGVIAVSDNTTRDNPFIAQVIPHGVDENIFTPWPADKTPEPSVLFVGALDGRKRGRFLLDAFLKTIRPAHPDATLTIVGGAGPTHPGVRFVTGVSDAELAALYRRAWVYASPSTYEGFGLPYLEAMACGTPVVASENPGSLDVLGAGRCGVLPTDDEFAATVAALLGDEGRRAELSAAGLQRASQFTLTRMLESYERVLFDLTGTYVKSMASV